MHVLHVTVLSQVFISSRQQDQVQYLNIDQPITALCRHPLDDTTIALGTDSHLIIYDAIDNKIKWSKEVQSQIHSWWLNNNKKKLSQFLFFLCSDWEWSRSCSYRTLRWRRYRSCHCRWQLLSSEVLHNINFIINSPFILTKKNSFNMTGDEIFWHVMSDQVTSLAIVDCGGPGHNQVIN